jgi:signal peptidase I
MEPVLPRGSILLVNRAAYGIVLPFQNTYVFRFHTPAIDDVVMYEDPADGLLKIKRCFGTEGTKVFLVGDNRKASLDSRIYGSLPVEKVLGKVLISIKR